MKNTEVQKGCIFSLHGGCSVIEADIKWDESYLSASLHWLKVYMFTCAVKKTKQNLGKNESERMKKQQHLKERGSFPVLTWGGT